MPVIFCGPGGEVNSRSFPFSFGARRDMLESVFGDSIEVSKSYTFYAPFSRYMPPLLSPKSWRLRRQILDGVKGDYFTYTGDRAEGYMLRMYRLHPKIGHRKETSATSVKEKMYVEANGAGSDWRDYVPSGVARIISESWETVVKFAGMEDQTTRVAGMKFPKEGYR